MIDEIRLRWEYIVDNPYELVFAVITALVVLAVVFAMFSPNDKQ